jgi:serine/threonine protein kinase
MAPECWERTSSGAPCDGPPPEVGPQSDMYSLGITLAELVAGRRPWHGVSSAAIAIRTTLLGARPESQELDDPARWVQGTRGSCEAEVTMYIGDNMCMRTRNGGTERPVSSHLDLYLQMAPASLA